MNSKTKTWFTSDTHFFHSNIINYCKRPFVNAEEMNEYIIKQWNSVVEPQDEVYHLGDFAFGTKEEITKIVSQLNGRIYLVKGNHDRKTNSFYRDCGFAEVYDKPIVLNEFFICSHKPLLFITGQATLHLYGHVHNSDMFETYADRSCCVCVERHNYTPISLDELKELYS